MIVRRLLFLLPLVLAACGGTAPQTFATHSPPFRPEAFFAGHLRSAGLFADRFGAIGSWFTAELTGGWDGTTLTFSEVFTYDDGWVDRRTWHLRRVSPTEWRGTATDAVGEVTATETGNAFHLLHTLDMPRREGGTRRLSFDQWFVRVSADTALSRAAVSAYGVEVGVAQVSFRKLD